MEINPETNIISVHGRECLKIPYSRWEGDGNNRVQLDISASTIFLEIPAINFRTQLLVDPGDAKGLLIFMEREDVERLPTAPTPFAIVDETVEDQPDVEWEGRIYRRGYKGAPDAP